MLHGLVVHGAVFCSVMAAMGHAAHELVDHIDEQLGIGAGEVLNRVVFALLGQGIELTHGAQHLGRLFHLGDPGIETGLVLGGNRLELHARETGAAVTAGDPLVLTRLVGNQVQLGLHPGHGVDLTAQLGDEEGVHHSV